MSAPALLLRVLLCVTLALNGSGYAVAATDMEVSHLSSLAATDAMHDPMGPTSVLPSGKQMPCHEAGKAVTKHAGNTAAGLIDTRDSDATPAEEPECCASHGGCACLQHLTATVPELEIRTAMVGHFTSHSTMSTAHAAPPLPHLIRPPIG